VFQARFRRAFMARGKGVTLAQIGQHLPKN
jgi:hypothetical protein